MSQEPVKFCVTMVGDEIEVAIEGTSMELANLLANVIHESEDIEMVVSTALMAVQMKRDVKEMSDEEIVERMSKIKPIAEA